MDTLAEIVERDGALPVRDAIGWTIRTALTVWLLHGDGVLHGSLSLAAVEVASPRCDAQGRLRPAQQCPDAPTYHDYERGPDGEPSGDDDVWALGVMLYLLLTGEHPYPDGVRSALEGDRVKEATPLALHDGNLDVMQPILDRFLDPEIPFGSRSVEEVVGALQDFSPAIADLPPLDYEVPKEAVRPKEGTAASATARPAAWPTWVWVATIAVPLAFGMALGLRWMDEGEVPVARTSAPAPSSAAPPPSPVGSSSSDPYSPVSSLPEPSADASPPGSEDMLACVGALFDSSSFVAKPMIDFPCREREARRSEAEVQKTLIAATDGKIRSATSEWAGLGWYRLAAVAVLRGRCCNAPTTMEGPPLLRVCKLDGALAQLTSAAAQRSDKKLASAMDTYRRAIACASAAGGQGMLAVEGRPTAQQAALFVKMLSRLGP